MALTASPDLPTIEQFALLSDHQQETPASFFGGKSVLHLRCPSAAIRISSDDFAAQPALAALRHGDEAENAAEVTIEEIDVWVTSSNLILVSSAQAKSIQIPYQTITIHAQEGNAVLLGLNLSDANTADEDLVFIQFRIVPSKVESYGETDDAKQEQQTNGDASHGSKSAQALFKVIADCQELNPDPPEEGEEEFDEAAPGATGWITSENMQDYLDENGQFRMPEGVTVIGDEKDEDGDHQSLGQGAGRTRTAHEADASNSVEEETKWQRTG